MRIGILTFHYGSNYGGVLQCYALQQVLTSQGHEVKVINYVPGDSLKQLLIVVNNALHKRDAMHARALLHYILHRKSSRKVFEAFREKHLNMTDKRSRIEDFANLSFDAVIVGSDQVWNYSQQKNVAYFLGWLNNDKVRKISYAACCGQNKINTAYRSSLVRYLSQFSAISVRSEETKYFIRDLLDKDVPVVADPTILYDFTEFVHPKNENYILTYILTEDIQGGNDKAVSIIKNLFPDLPVYSIVISDRQPRLCPWADKQLFDVSPSEWVSLIANCKFLFTDSFHGSIFAMKFNRPFVAYYNTQGSGRRFVDLKETFHLHNVVCSAEELCSLSKDSFIQNDYTKEVNLLREQSIDFLKSNLHN